MNPFYYDGGFLVEEKKEVQAPPYFMGHGYVPVVKEEPKMLDPIYFDGRFPVVKTETRVERKQEEEKWTLTKSLKKYLGL